MAHTGHEKDHKCPLGAGGLYDLGAVGCAVPPRIAAPDDCREPERASNLNIIMHADGF